MINLSLKSLVGMALQETDLESDNYWNLIHTIRNRANLQTLQMVQKIFQARNWRKRVLAVNIICQLGYWNNQTPKKYYAYAVEEAQKMLLEAISDENIQVVNAAIFGLNFRVAEEALPELLKFAKHQNSKLRFATAFALGSYKEQSAIDALLVLATDKDDETRDWATFTLGSLHIEVDTPELRERLYLNCSDENLDISGEALSGLAVRKDPRVHDLIFKRLQICDFSDFFIQEAAEEMQWPKLSQALEEWECSNNKL